MYYTVDQLETLNIYELRCLGREVGVKSPTSKKRGEIIQTILDIQNGIISPTISHQGRPAKPFDFSPSRVESQQAIKTTNGYDAWSLNFLSRFAGCRNFLKKEIQVSGYLARYQLNYCLISFDNPMGAEVTAFGDENFINSLGLEIGDFCEADCKFVRGSDIPLIKEILSVDGEKLKNINKPFDALKANFDCNPLKLTSNANQELKQLNILQGDNVLVKIKDDCISTQYLEQICNSFDELIEIVVVSFSVIPKYIFDVQKNSRIKMFFSLFSDAFAKQKFTYDLALEYCKKQVVNGKDVVLIINNLDCLEETEKHLNVGLNLELTNVKSLLGLARKTENNASITILSCVHNQNIQSLEFVNKFFQHRIEEK